MSAQQFKATVADEEEFRYEVAERQRMDALEQAAESQREFADELASRFPILKSWPGREKK